MYLVLEFTQIRKLQQHIGGEKMNANELKGKITASGMNVQSFCEKNGFNRSTFDRKLNGSTEFNRDEIERIISALDLTWEDVHKIFFAERLT